uniref:Uncharacterized protein n=1 Tax=Cairina moschata TaxID=8855 RepID=A0A8C3BQN3_CAIMO
MCGRVGLYICTWSGTSGNCDRFPESIPNTDLLLVSVQNGSIHQKDAVNDDDFEPYLSSQTNQVKRSNYKKLQIKQTQISKRKSTP